eukprot:g1654.t1
MESATDDKVELANVFVVHESVRVGILSMLENGPSWDAQDPFMRRFWSDLTFDPVKAATGNVSPTASTASEDANVDECVSSISDEETPSTKTISKPRFLNSVTLSQIDWTRLAKKQEWRTVIQLRAAPRALCRPGAMEALLHANGMGDDVEKVKVSLKSNGQHGSAVLHATSTEAVGKLSRFFHGRQFLGSRMPIAVSFAESKAVKASASPKKASVARLVDPLQIHCMYSEGPLLAFGGLMWVVQPCERLDLPPGLEEIAYASLAEASSEIAYL